MYTRKQKNKQKKRNNKKKTIKGGINGGSTELLEFMATFGIKIKDFFSGNLAKGFYSIFAGIGQGVLIGFEQLWKFMLYIWKEFGKGLNSPCVRIILIIFGILASFSVVGWGLTATGVANVFGAGGLVTGWLTTVASINIFNIIGSIFTILWNVVVILGENLLMFLFTGPNIIVTLTWSIILAGVSGMILAFISNTLENLEIIKEYKKTKDVNKALSNIQGRKKTTDDNIVLEGNIGNEDEIQTGGKISLRDKMSKLSTKKMLAIFNSIPKKTMDKVREENPTQFFIAILIGFIKETETGYEFTEQGIKTLKSIINSSMNIIDKHCPKGESCKPLKSRKEREPVVDDAINNLSDNVNKDNKDNNKKKNKKNKTQKNTEELSYDDALEIKELLTSLEFVHMSSIHASIRENEENFKSDGEINGGSRRKLNTKKTLNHLKKEDVEWLKSKHPEKFESAKKMGFVNSAFEMTDISAKVLEECDNVNGISISKTYAEPIRSQ